MKADFCVIGGGIAGLSVAAELSGDNSVILLEREQDLAYHTTGRSAALYSELSADSVALALSKLTRPFLLEPPEGFSNYPLYDHIPCIFTATSEELGLLTENAKKLADPQILSIEEMLERVPVLRTGGEHICGGLLEKDSFRIDVAALVQGFRNQLRHNKGEIGCDAEVMKLNPDGDSWEVILANGEKVTCNSVINASGAWGDVIAERAGVRKLGLTPLRRNIIIFDGPEGIDFSDWPAVASISGSYYFLPESGKLMGSAADEVPSVPCDAQPEEYDIALAAHNIESTTSLEIKNIAHKWGGLRTFSPDRQLVAGFDSEKPGFFWLVGQGGFGIQTSAAAARVACQLVKKETLNDEFISAGITKENLSPARFNNN